MSGRSGYGNGYGYSDSSRYDNGDARYGSSENLSGSGYSSRNAGSAGRRPGGYGGFYPEPSQQPSLSPGAVPSPVPSPERRRERPDREPRQQSPQPAPQPPPQSASRPRPRPPPQNPEADRRYQAPPRSERPPPNRYAEARKAQRPPPQASPAVNTDIVDDSGEKMSVEEVLQFIQRDWDFMTDAECIPVNVALNLMDTSTLGKADREPEFLSMYNQIQRTLKSIVNEHHQGFNSSIGTYHKIQGNISSSQGRVRNLRNSLDEAKAGLLSTKPELKGLATSSQKYDDILQLFTQIEEIQSLPEKLESRISDKRFLAAVEVLHTGLRLLRRSELEEIGALADVRAYFNNQETSLTDILIEELHDHLYLKSPYCSDRWKAPVAEGELNSTSWTGNRSWERPVYSFLAKFDPSTPMVEDASRNPEADTFSYIQLLIEALSKMGHLDVAVDRIEQRLPVELFAVVDKTNAEVDARYPTPNRTYSSHENQLKSQLPTENIEQRGHVLSEFLWALYAKFESIAEGHRVVHDVVSGIVDREGHTNRENLADGFKELWKLLQSEIRSLLHDYLATDGEAARSRGEESETRRNLHPSNRDKNKKMFKLSDLEQNSEMKAEQDELDEILKSSVPGLVSKSRQKASTNDASATAKGNSGTGHKILLEPSVFNMRLLLPPSLSFIQRLKDIVPVGSDISMNTLTSFLDDFMVNVFLPQLDETVTDLCTLSFIAADAFTEDPQWSQVSPRPIFRGTVKFMTIVREFSKMLSSIPHDQAFTQLLIDQVVTYYDKCCGWYKAMVTKVSARNHGGAVRLKAAAAFAESGDIHGIVDELWIGGAGEKKQTLIDTEIDLLLKKTTAVPLEPYDIISDPKTVVSLSLLYNSMQWLGSHLTKIRLVIDPATEPINSTISANGRPSRRWTLYGAVKPKRDSVNSPVYLPLNNETAAAFDKTVQSLHSLGSNAILTLHVDIRCGIIHMLTKTMSGPNPPINRNSEPTTPVPSTTDNWWHIIMNQPTAASPTILELNNDLIAFDTNISTYLGPAERWFITSGLARVIDRVFVASTSFIGAMNENGALRLQLDVLVLQQNLKNIIIDPSADPATQEVVALPRSAKFLDWFLEGAEKALDYAKEEKETFASQGEKALAAGNGEPFTYEELRILVDLCFSETLRGPRGAESREDFMFAKKASADALLRLNEVMWDAR